MNELILVVEDEEILRENLCELLARAGYDVEGAPDGEAAIKRITEDDFAVVVSDIRMPRMDGITLLKHIVNERPETHVLLITAYASVDTAVEALRHGAFDYLLKPVAFEDLLQKVKNLVDYRSLQSQVRRLSHDFHTRLGFEGIVGQSTAIKEVFELVEKVAPTNSTVLLTGESGTGKELVARAIATRSSRPDADFVAVNMAAIPTEMVEAQLFGHEKGAFTGAERKREGILRSARGGTVFLDEISELPVSAQAKLLRALENGEVLPIGATRQVRTDFRLIAATNQDLEQAVEERRFRQDLFFRINVFGIRMPPLRERREDIPPLVTHFIERHARSVGRRPEGVSNEAMKLLLAYHWPGNVRELSNVIERATILAGAALIQPSELPAELRSHEGTPLELREAVAQFERRHINWVLDVACGNREKAAQMLSVDPATLYRRLAKYDIG